MKPIGVTAAMLLNTPSRVEDAVWDAVERARAAGWTVAQFRAEAAAAWDHELREEQKAAAHEWRKP